jgi:hypothetical protein
LGYFLPIAIFQVLFHVGAALKKKIRARMYFWAVAYKLAQKFYVGFVDTLWVCQYDGDMHWHRNL